MAGFEDLIRGAIEKQGNLSAEQREGVYNSSRQALERMLAKKPTLDPNSATEQRQRLQKAISDIEASYAVRDIPAPAPAPAPTPTPAAPPQPKMQTPTPAPAPAPEVKSAQVPTGDLSGVAASRPTAAPANPAPAQRIEPEMVVPDIPMPAHAEQESAIELEPEPFNPVLLRRSKKRSYAKLFLWTIILVGIGVAAWWAWTFGPDLIRSRLDGSVPNPNPAIESGAFVPEGGEGWVNVFEPDTNPENLDLANRSAAELIQADGRTFARISSNPGNSSNTVLIKVPRGIMETLKGEAATFEVMLRSSNDDSQQFAIFCEFKTMGSCGRKRFSARKQLEAYIFDVLVNDKSLTRNQEAHIAFNTDLALVGKALDLYSIRVRTGN